MNTNDLSDFGMIELREASKILTAYCDGKLTARAKENFGSKGVKLEFNTDSGNVFLVDDDYNVLMIDDDGMLDLWLITPDGDEGYFDDLIEGYDDMSADDKEYMKCYDTEHTIDDKKGDDDAKR